MSWREGIVIRILLMVARMFADDLQLRQDIQALANHISVEGKREREKALAAAGLIED